VSSSSEDETETKKPFWQRWGGDPKKEEKPVKEEGKKKKNDDHVDSESSPKRRWSWFRRQQREGAKNNEEVSKEEPENKKEPSKPKWRMRRNKRDEAVDETKPEDKKKEEVPLGEDKNDESEEKSKDTEVQKDTEEEGNKEQKEENEDINPSQTQHNQTELEQQLSRPQYSIVYRTLPVPSSSLPQRGPIGPGHPMPSPQSQALVAAAVANLLTLASRLFLIKWLVSKLAFESEAKIPEQHFMWECLNDKYVKDEEIWKRVLHRSPPSFGHSPRKWDKIVNRMLPKKERNVLGKDPKPERPEPTRTVVVIDFSTHNIADPDFSNFASIVTFLVGANAPRKKFFGSDPEVVLLLHSGGGEVTTFALAAAQVARLRSAGWQVTACVDRIAASGGYMIASQATQIVAAPFAMVGSIGVMLETFNFYDILKENGIQPLSLKAGEMKNPVTPFGKVTEKNLKMKQQDLEETQLSFIALCRSRRPMLDPGVCNGRILTGDSALDKGMIDRVSTSDDYILEKITDGDLVMKIHLVSATSERFMFARALEILPHLRQKLHSFLAKASGRFSGQYQAPLHMDSNLVGTIVQGMALASMIMRAMKRSTLFKNS
jgi:serine protease SohB